MNARGLQASSGVGLRALALFSWVIFFDIDAARWGDSSVPVTLARMGGKRMMFLRPMWAPGVGQFFGPLLGAFLGPFWLMVCRGGGSEALLGLHEWCASGCDVFRGLSGAGLADRALIAGKQPGLWR